MGPYFPDTIMIKSQNQHHLKGYIQWNTFSKNAAHIRDFTPITLRLSIFDKAGNASNVVVFPLNSSVGVCLNMNCLPLFNKDDTRLGYVIIDLYDPFSATLEVPEPRR